MDKRRLVAILDQGNQLPLQLVTGYIRDLCGRLILQAQASVAPGRTHQFANFTTKFGVVNRSRCSSVATPGGFFDTSGLLCWYRGGSARIKVR